VRDGDVDAWRWGEHDRKNGFTRDGALDALCARAKHVRADAVAASAPLRTGSRAGPGAMAAVVAALVTVVLAMWWRRLARARRENPETG
jgi:ferric-dicitrate binding protein FerR (iron transport regulator)